MNKKLPIGWMWTRLEGISDLIRGVTYKKVESSKETRYGYLPILRANNINKELIFNDIVYVPQKNIKKEQYIKAYDILIAMSSGSKHLVGKAAQAFEDFNGSFGTFCGLIRPFAGINKRFFGLFFQSLFYTSEISKVSMGVNINNLRRSNIESLNFPLLPLPEQKLIVEKIEELFSKLDAGVEALEKVKKQLKRYRQAVLKAAFEGKLTSEWRQQMLSEKDTEMNHFPLGWNRSELISVSEINPKLSRVPPNNIEVSFIPMKAVEAETGRYDLSIIKKYFEVKKGYTSFENGDLIFAKITPCMENGKVALVENLKNGIGFGSTEFHIIRVNKVMLNKKFIFYFLVQKSTRRDAKHNMTGTAGQLRVPSKYLKQLKIPIPSLNEQQKIVEEINKKFQMAYEVEKVVDESLKQTKRLRQSILREAFNGNLTKEWREKHINELEPAEELLERIKREKEMRK